MPRTMGWKNRSVTTKRPGPDKEKQFKARRGEKYIIRVMTGCDQFRTHAVDDVLDPKENGEPSIFNMNCSKTWDDDSEDWVGSCLGCDREYKTNDQYVCGILLLGEIRGNSRRVQPVDPDKAPRWWRFGPSKYCILRDIALELEEAETPRTLTQIELVLTCEDKHDAEQFQKIGIQKSERKALTTKEYLSAWKDLGSELCATVTAIPTADEQARQLKKRKSKSTSQAPRSAPDPEPQISSSGDSTGDDGDLDNENIDDLLAEAGLT